jgi:hypothetical protein
MTLEVSLGIGLKHANVALFAAVKGDELGGFGHGRGDHTGIDEGGASMEGCVLGDETRKSMPRIRIEISCREDGSEQAVGDLAKLIKRHLPGQFDGEDSGYHSRGIIIKVSSDEVKQALRGR